MLDINKLSDDDFIKFAQYFRRNKLNLQEYVTVRDIVIKRCRKLGYEFTAGCCGVNQLNKIHDNQK